MRFFTLLALGLAGSAAALPANSGSVTPTPTSSAVATGTVAATSTSHPLPSPTARVDQGAPPPVKQLQNQYYNDYHSWETATGKEKEKMYKVCEKDLNHLGRAEATYASKSAAGRATATPTPSVPSKRRY